MGQGPSGRRRRCQTIVLENAARSLSVHFSSPADAPPTSRFYLGRVSESVATVCEFPNMTFVRAASLGVNVRLALTTLQNGSPGSRPRRVLTSRRCRHNLSFPAISTCPLFTLHHFYFLPVFSSPPPHLLLRLPLLCVHAARPDSFDLRAVHVVEI